VTSNTAVDNSLHLQLDVGRKAPVLNEAAYFVLLAHLPSARVGEEAA
jgi:hypothetical protein